MPDIREIFSTTNISGEELVLTYDNITSVGWALNRARLCWEKPEQPRCEFMILKGLQILECMNTKLYAIFDGYEQGERRLTCLKVKRRYIFDFGLHIDESLELVS